MQRSTVDLERHFDTRFQRQSAAMGGLRKQVTGLAVAMRSGGPGAPPSFAGCVAVWARPTPASGDARGRNAADPCKIWVGGPQAESLRDSIVEQLTLLVVGSLREARSAAFEVRALVTFPAALSAACVLRLLARAFARVRCFAGCVLDADGSWTPLRCTGCHMGWPKPS